MRVVLWLSGCSHHCKGCQNPQTWDPNGGILFDEKTKEELFSELDKDYISGLTLSGGDPLNEANLDGVLNILTEFNKRYKQTQKTIWLYTGYKINISEQYNCDHLIVDALPLDNNKNDFIREKIIRNCDIIIDGKYIENLRDVSLEWRGSSNQRIIDIQKSLKENKIILWKAG